MRPRLLLPLVALSFALFSLSAVTPSKDGAQRDNSITYSLWMTEDATCERFYDLPRLCLPTPNEALPVVEVGPNDECSRGYYPTQTIDIRKLYTDTILLKETGDPMGEAPVMALFLGEESALLLDSGNGSIDMKEVIAPILAYGVDAPRDVLLLNTHLHGDHIASNASFDVIAIETDEVKAHCQVDEDELARDLSAACKSRALYTPPQEQTLFGSRSFRVVRVVRDGYQLDLEGRALAVMYTPGHSETSIALYDARHQLLFTGDSLYPGSNPPLIHPETGSHFSAYLKTAERFFALSSKVRFVIGAHGEGLMPPRVLESFLMLVRARFYDPEDSADFIDDECPAADYVMGNDPAR